MEKQKSQKPVMVAGVAVIAVLIGVIVFLLLKQEAPAENVAKAETRRNVVVNQQDAEEAVSEMASMEYVEPGYYTVNMATEWHFSKGEAISRDARVDNLAGNTNPVYFDVFLEGNEEEPVYSSPVIPVGSFLEGIALDTPLGAGVYDCVMVYHLVDEDQNTVSTLRVTIQIIVES